MKNQSKIKESIPFTTATKRIKCLGINLPKETKELYTGNYKTLMKEIKDDINRWRDIPCSWVGRINIEKMTIQPNTICWFNEIPIKLPMAFFTELKQKFHNSYGKKKKTLNSQSRMELEESSFLTSDYTTKLQSSRQYGNWHKNRNIDQWNKIESPETNPCNYEYLIFDKGG